MNITYNIGLGSGSKLAEKKYIDKTKKKYNAKSDVNTPLHYLLINIRLKNDIFF